jgi:hypothetical protein
MLGVLIVGEDLLERGAGESIADSAREFAEIEALAGWNGRAKEALEAAAQVLRADEERLGIGGAGLDEADGRARGKCGEEIFVANGIEVLAAVEFQHEDRI